jgi:hypothetical protein
LFVITAAISLVPQMVTAQTIKTVARQGEDSPLVGFPFNRFREPVIGDALLTRVAVYSTTRGGERCIFGLDPDGGPGTSLACYRDASPYPSRQYVRISDPTINATNQSAWTARLTYGFYGVFRSDPIPTVVALLGDPVPLPGTGLLKVLTLARITNAGPVVFESTISGGAVVLGVEINQGIFRCVGGNGNCSAANGGTGILETLALVNDPVTDRPGREFCSYGALAASNYGIFFRATTKNDCADGLEAPLNGVFRMPYGGPVQTVALTGEPAEPFPTPGGTVYADPQDLGINDTGFVTFRANTSGLLSTTGLYVCDPVTCPAAPADAAVLKGEVDDDGNAFNRLSTPVISNAGDIAFSARLRLGTSRYGVYIRRLVGDDIETIALRGDATPPDLAGGFFLRFYQPSISSAGKVAFRARIKWPVSNATRYGIFAFE